MLRVNVERIPIASERLLAITGARMLVQQAKGGCKSALLLFPALSRLIMGANRT
jgi:hypothetical protein